MPGTAIQLVLRPLGATATWTTGFGVPGQVCWDGSSFAIVERSGTDLEIRRFALDGTPITPDLTVPRPAGAGLGALRIAAASDGWYVVDADRAIRVASDGSVPAAPVEVNLAGSVTSNATEALVLGRIASGEATAWRIDDSGAELAELPFHAVRTSMDLNPDAAAWTGAEWVLGFSDDVPGLAEQARWTTICD